MSGAANRACPRCGKLGSLVFDQSAQAWRCTNCHTSRVELIPSKTKTQPPPASDVVSNGIPPSATIRDMVVDKVRYKGTDGRIRSREVSRFYVPHSETYPDLSVDVSIANWVKWRLDQDGFLTNERRYGRDWMRKQGYIKRTLRLRNGTGKTRDVKLMVAPQMKDLTDEQLREVLIEMVRRMEQGDA